MSASVPDSILTSEELLKISGFDRTIADHLDEALSNTGSGVRVVAYEATGAESPSGFTVPIGATLASANYHVSFFSVEDGIIVPWAWSFTAKTTTQFEARFSGDELTAGGFYFFEIVE